MFPFFHYLRHSSGFKPVTSWDSSYLDFATESKEYKRSLEEQEEKPDNHAVALECSFAEGYAEALSVAHFLIFDEQYNVN
jgi:hypothetical protein